MNTVLVDREELLARLRENRRSHFHIFEKASDIFREQVIEQLDKNLQDARRGKKIIRSILLPAPQNHTVDYDNAIAMLQMEKRTQVEVSRRDFNCYALDQWDWVQEFVETTSSYIAPPGR